MANSPISAKGIRNILNEVGEQANADLESAVALVATGAKMEWENQGGVQMVGDFSTNKKGEITFRGEVAAKPVVELPLEVSAGGGNKSFWGSKGKGKLAVWYVVGAKLLNEGGDDGPEG